MRGIGHGVRQEMLVIAIREIGALERATRFMARIGGGNHGLGERDEVAHLPDGGDFLIERGRLIVRGKRLRARCKIVVDRFDRRGKGLRVAAHRSGTFHRRWCSGRSA